MICRGVRVLASAYLGAWAADVGWWIGRGAERGHAPAALSIVAAAYVTLSVSISYADRAQH